MVEPSPKAPSLIEEDDLDEECYDKADEELDSLKPSNLSSKAAIEMALSIKELVSFAKLRQSRHVVLSEIAKANKILTILKNLNQVKLLPALVEQNIYKRVVNEVETLLGNKDIAGKTKARKAISFGTQYAKHTFNMSRWFCNFCKHTIALANAPDYKSILELHSACCPDNPQRFLNPFNGFLFAFV